MDELDVRMLTQFRERPRIAVVEVARRLGVARRTVQTRLDRLIASGVIRGFGPELDLESLGFGVLAFTTVEIRQGAGRPVVAALRGIPEVLEVFGITGGGDLLCRIVARDHRELKQVIDAVLDIAGVQRTDSVIVLSTEVGYRDPPLLITTRPAAASARTRPGRPAGTPAPR